MAQSMQPETNIPIHDNSLLNVINKLQESNKQKRRKNTKKIQKISLLSVQPSLLELPSKPVETISDMNGLISTPKTLRNWCLKIGFVLDHTNCAKCSSLVKLQITNNKLYWVCLSKIHQHHPFHAKVKIPFMFRGLDVRKVVLFLFMWYNRVPSSSILRKITISREQYKLLNSTTGEACIFTCIKGSQKIGGPNIRVNVEIAKKSKCQDNTDLIIGGVEEDDYKMTFLTYLTSDITSFTQLHELTNRWILPGSIVYTSSLVPEALTEMGWKGSNSWTMICNSGNIAENLWRQYLSTSENPFEEFVKGICDYYKK